MAFNRNKSLTKAQKFFQKGKLADAIAVYQEIVDNDPADVWTLLKIGDLQAKLGNVESANDTYRKVAEHYAKDGFFLKAVAVFKQILKLDPGLISVYLRLAELYQQLGLSSEAMKQYQVVVRHYESKGLKKESLDVLRKMAELDPENTANKLKLAELYSREGHAEAATDQLKTLATSLKEKGNLQELSRVYEKMELLNVADLATSLDLCESYLKLADPKKALSKLQTLFQTDPKNNRTLELLARTFSELAQPEKARSVYQELVAVLNEKGMKEERDRIVAKIRALGLTDDVSPMVGGLPKVPSAAVPSVSMDDEKTRERPAPPPAAAAKGSPAGGGPITSPAKLLAEVEVFLQYGLVDKACQILSRAIARDPSSADIRQKLIETFQAKGDLGGLAAVLEEARTAAQSQGLTALAVEIGNDLKRAQGGGESDGAAAPAETDEILVADELVAEEEASLEVVEDGPEMAVADDAAEISVEFDESLSLEEPAAEAEAPAAMDVPVSEVSFEADFERSEAAESSASLSDSMFALKEPEEEAPQIDMEVQVEPPVDEPDQGGREELLAEPAPGSSIAEEEEPEESAELAENTSYFARHSEGEDEFAADMEEAAYFAEQGLVDEAVEVCEGILAQRKDHAAASLLLKELKGSAPAVKAPAARPVAKKARPALPDLDEDLEAPAPKVKASPADESAGGLFNLSNELQDEIADLEESLSEPKPAEEDEDYLSPEEVIAEFKKGVARTVAKDDHQTHYNLGIAYKEMGLLNEAIHEFELAQKNPKMALDCTSMIGLCLLGKKDYTSAISVYKHAVARIAPDKPEALGLSYELAEAYIGNGNLVDAYKLFARIREIDPTFRDVRRRAKELELDLGASAPPMGAPEKPSADKKSVVKIPGKKNKISYI